MCVDSYKILVCSSHTVPVLYQPHPSTWPIFTPRDKVADMLESYAVNQDLVVWTSSSIVGRPTYSQERKVWTLIVDHAGEQVEMHPVHVVLATGTPGDPYTPTLENRDRFTGTAIHATQYMNPKTFLGKDVIVVGAGNSSIDICQDLATNGAKSVTMVQRSSTCVVSREHVAQGLSSIWQQGVPVEVGDFKFASTPFGFSKKMMINRVQESWAEETELHDKLRMGGLKINMGPEGQGQFLLVFERGGGALLRQRIASGTNYTHLHYSQGIVSSRIALGYSDLYLEYRDGQGRR